MKSSLFRKNFLLIASFIFALTLFFVAIAIVLTDRLAVESSSTVLLKAAALAASELEKPEYGQAPSVGEKKLEEAGAALSRLSGYRVTIIGRDGTVFADSDSPAGDMENHAGRPEVRGAMAGKPSTALRQSTTTNLRMLYAAVPCALSDAQEAGPLVLRLAMPLPPVFYRLKQAQWIFVLLFFFFGALSLAISLAISRQITRPLGYILKKAEAYSKNAPPPRLTLPSELRRLDESLDDMVGKIRRRTQDAEDIGKRYSSILETAGEGVIAVDASLKIQEANSAASRLFGFSKQDMTGKTILEALGSRELADIFQECRDGGKELFREVRFFRNGEKQLKVHATTAGEGQNSSVVAVFSDISELKRLETLRKEFVANVSHELRTPIQIIQGYAEVLGGEAAGSESAQKALGLITQNARRMERIVADLLTLARLESDPGSWLKVEMCDLRGVIAAAVAAEEPRAAAKRIRIVVEAPDSLPCVANAGMIEQALINLLDNAVNYSPEASAVSLRAETAGQSCTISVSDQGIGIPQADLSHIFERFYRVDKSRSKSTGGTGLGLAIVRHIAAIHGGDVSAQSYVNEGSTFTLRLPLEGPRKNHSPSPPL